MNDDIKNRLAYLAAQAGGDLKPEAVIADAKDKTSPLHGCFEWDLKKAAHEHWMDTARALIRSVKVEVTIEEVRFTLPAYLKNPQVPGNETGYVPITKARNDSDMARAIIVDEFKRARAALERARVVAKALSMETTLETMIASIDHARDLVAGQAAVM